MHVQLVDFIRCSAQFGLADFAMGGRSNGELELLLPSANKRGPLDYDTRTRKVNGRVVNKYAGANKSGKINPKDTSTW